ncbi:MAG: PTS sugar transporter subunit IIA [Lachnospiraceae bacterium]|jgi:hypothetical protein|nr:PTS sugar transporter subunit IIA [Lachnospiraceae bacterium]
MRITDLLDKRSISLSGTLKSKSEALDQVVELMVNSGEINDKGAYSYHVTGVYHRGSHPLCGIRPAPRPACLQRRLRGGRRNVHAASLHPDGADEDAAYESISKFMQEKLESDSGLVG